MLLIFEWASAPWTFNWSILIQTWNIKPCVLACVSWMDRGCLCVRVRVRVFVSHWAICYALDLTWFDYVTSFKHTFCHFGRDAGIAASWLWWTSELRSMGPHHPSACGDGWSWADFQNQEAQGAKCLLHQKRTQVFVGTIFWSQIIAESMGRGGLGPVPLEADLETTGAQYSSKTCDEIRRLYLTSVAFGPSFLRELSYQSAKSPEEMVQVMLYCPA